MKAKSIKILVAYLLTALLAGSGVTLAQQPSTTNTEPAGAATREERNQQLIPSSVSDTPAGIPALQQLIEQALENNPEIKAMQRRFDMMRARIPQAKALDEPMLSVGYMGNITPFQVRLWIARIGSSSVPHNSRARYSGFLVTLEKATQGAEKSTE